MKRQFIEVILILLLIGMLTSVFNFQPAKASGTVYIRPSGTVEATDKIQRDGDVYTFTDNIYDSIVIEKDNTVIDGAGYTLQGTGTHGINITWRSNLTAENVGVKAFYHSIWPEPSEETLGIYNFVESLSPGSVVILSFDFGPSTLSENYPQAKAFLFHCKQRGLRVIGVAFWPIALIGEDTFREVYGEAFPNLPEYGTDVVYLGYVPGNEVGMQTFGDDTWQAKGTDHYGNAIGDLPLMQECRSAEDFDIWLEVCSGTPGAQQVIQFIQGRHGGPSAVPLGAACTDAVYPGIKPFYDSGQLVGILWGDQGAFEYRWLGHLFGDMNDDNRVDMQDIGVAAKAFGSYPGHERWNPDADVNNDEKINLRDIALIAKNFGCST